MTASSPLKLSVLDLSPIIEGGDAAQSLRNTLDLAQHTERLGFERYWLAEHHNMPGIASAATSIVIAHVAAGTSRIRVGAGGIMLPNHAPLVIAEQFGTLDALFPGRIDLGLGRAPGSDQLTMRALRRYVEGADSFPQDVAELMRYFRGEPGMAVQAVPGAGAKVELWMLGSSTFGAQLAAVMGLPYSFASHFAPAQMMEALSLYRARFRPSEHLDRPHVMLGLNVVAADTDEEAQLLWTSLLQAFVNLRRGRPGKLKPPVPGYEQQLTGADLAIIQHSLSCAVVGSSETVRRGLVAFWERTGADELIITSQIFDHQARKRSYEIIADARDRLTDRALLERVSVLPTNEPVCREEDLPAAISMVIEGRARMLGGLPVARVLPERRCRAVGPFVFLDEMGPVFFKDGEGMDVPPHPHIGLATVTYLHEGALVHRDSLGSAQTILPGAVNLMSAGRGIVHSERSPASERVAGKRLHGLQLWVALPSENEQDEPAFEHHEAGALPAWMEDMASVRLLMGRWRGRSSPVSSPAAPFLLDVLLPAGSTFEVPMELAERAIYVVSGELRAGACVLPRGSLAVLVAGQPLQIEASVEARFAILGGSKLDAPRFIDWNFVATSRALIDKAREDWRHQRFAKVPGDEREFVPLPR